MELADRGVGFDPVAVSTSGDKLGLDEMRERVGLVAGRCNIDSAPGLGTRITVQIPLATENPEVPG